MAKLDIEKLVKIVGLLGSDHHGERASAALMASDLLKAYGVTWEDVFRSAFNADKPVGQRVRSHQDAREEVYAQYAQQQAHARKKEREDVENTLNRERWRSRHAQNPRYKTMNGVKAEDILRALKVLPRGLTDWDKDFVDNVIKQGAAKQGLTEKQWDLIMSLASKAGLLRKRAS